MTFDEGMENYNDLFNNKVEELNEWVKRLRANITPMKSRMFDAKKKLWQTRKNTVVDESLLEE